MRTAKLPGTCSIPASPVTKAMSSAPAETWAISSMFEPTWNSATSSGSASASSRRSTAPQVSAAGPTMPMAKRLRCFCASRASIASCMFMKRSANSATSWPGPVRQNRAASRSISLTPNSSSSPPIRAETAGWVRPIRSATAWKERSRVSQ